MRQRSFATVVVTAVILALLWVVWAPDKASAGIYNANGEVTYKEYWVPHSEYTGGRADTIGCVDTTPTGYSWYIEPVKASASLDCIKTVRINIPDNFLAALKAELYLDLWRAHTTLSAQYRINGGEWRAVPVGQEWSRTPFLVDLPLNDLVTGLNTFQFREVGGQYHVHDIGIRLYFDSSHPLLNSQGQPYQAPQGELVSVWADNGSLPAASGGSLTVNDDQLVLTAHLASTAKYIEFHGYYRGYDLDVNDSDHDAGALDTEWQNRARNNFQVGGLATLDTGGTQDHIGTVETPTTGDYSIWWPIPTVINQSGVLFKIRIVDANGVVREAASGVSAPFTLTRSGNQATHWVPNFADIGLYMGGNKPTSATRTLNLSSTPANYQEAYLIGSYWENPNISINNVVTFTAFTTGSDKWGLSVRSFNPAVLATGANTIRYTHVTGFGEFVEKPGPLILLKQTTQAADTTPPNITGRTPGPGATNVAENATLVVSVADAGRGVNFNTLKLKVDGAPVIFARSGTPDEYTLSYTPEAGWQPGSTVSVSVDACDFAGRCMSTATHTFTVQVGSYTLTVNKLGNGDVAVEPLQPTYNYGDVVTLTATPESGWEFSDWNALATNWWDVRWDYRAPITVAANGYARKNRPVELSVNFTALLSSLGQSSAFNPQSIRVVEVNSAGVVIDDHVQFQFDRASDYNASTKAAGTLIFLVKGDLPAAGERYYHLYFDIVSKNFAAADVGDSVVLGSGLDEYWGSYLIKTDNATYAYHLQGGGFSSMVDVNGNDWLDYHDNPPDERGAYRGLPNLVPPPDGLFHPGKQDHLTTRVYSGPLKETFRTKTVDGKWEVQWEVYPTYATMTVLKRPSNKNYWWLYEGPPGGVVEDTVTPAQRDFVTLATGTSFPINQGFSSDLVGDEWGFISDPDVDNSATVARSIYLIHYTDDTAVDSFHTQITGGAQTTKRMPIWGFGRNDSTTQTYLSATPNRFSMGFMDETAYAAGATVVNGVYRDLLVTLGNAAARSAITHLGDTTTITVTVTGDTVITAAFAPAGSVYTLDASVNGSGSVSKNPAQAAYLPGQVVTLVATPANGWSFSSWSGNLTGSTNPATITMNGDRAVTANFVQAQHTVTLNTVGSGTATKTPNQATYTHATQVTLSATPSTGWLFTGWSGDFVGTTNPVLLDVNSNLVITANFAPSQLTINTVIVGSGTVSKNPNQATHPYGSLVTLTANPATGWVFAGWSGDVVDSINPVTVEMLANKTVTATFALQEFTLNTSVLAGNGTLARIPDQATYLYNTVVTLTATADPGWLFSGWGGALSGTATPALLTMSSNKQVTASFTAIPYTLTTAVAPAGQGNVAISPLQPTYQYGDAITLTPTAQPGWRFDHWSGDLSGTANPGTAIVTGTQVITANFVQEQYSLTTAVAGSGSLARSPEQPTYLYNTVVTLTATAGAGWLFDHWEGSLSGGINPANVTITASQAITAVYTAIPYTLTLTTEGSGSAGANPAQPSYIYGDPVTLIATADTGWTFVEWTGARQTTDNPATLVITGTQAATAHFARLPVSLTTESIGNGAIQTDPGEPYRYGDAVTLTAVADPHATFSGWSGDVPGGTGATNPLLLTLDGDKNVTAHFDPVPYTLNLPVASGQGTVSKNPDKGSYLFGESVTVTVQPADGWFFTGWSGDLSGDDNPASVVITDNMTVQAGFTQSPFAVLTTVVGSGVILLDPNQAVYEPNTTITVKAQPSAGWLFDHWSGGLSGKANPATLLVDSDKMVTAIFVPKSYTLATSAKGSGTVTVTPAKNQYQHGEQVTLTANPSDGWVFTGWSGDLGGGQSPITIVMNGNKTIVANFSQNPVTLTTQVSGHGHLLINPDKALYAPGEVVTLTAVADPDWLFSGWSGDLSDTTNPATLVMNSSKSVTANFAEDTSTGVLKSDGFNACTYSTKLWTWHDPLGDAPAPEVTGEEIRLTVPAGVTHDVWKNGVEAPYLTQVITDQDFVVVTQFTSVPTATIQLQGMLFKEGDNRTLRVNFQREGNDTILFVGLVRNGLPPQRKARVVIQAGSPLSLRVQHTGDSWAIAYREGQDAWATDPSLNFIQEMAVDALGPFVGNAARTGATPPAFTAVIDSVVNTAKPLPADDPLATHLTVKTSGQGTISKDAECGNPVQLTASAGPGWSFVRWDETTAAGTRTLDTANPLTVSYTKDSVVTAVFAPAALQLNLHVVGSGEVEVDPAQASYTAGDTVTLTPRAQPGWLFAGWSGDLAGVDNPAQVTLDSSKSITATFLQLFALTVSFDSTGGQVEVTPQKERYADGEEVTLTATPNTGYTFVEWVVNGEIVSAGMGSTANPLKLAIYTDTTVEVRFAVEGGQGTGLLFLPLVSTP